MSRSVVTSHSSPFSFFPENPKQRFFALFVCARLSLHPICLWPMDLILSIVSSPQQTIILTAGLSHSIARICNKVSSMNFWGGECVY